MRNYSLSVVLLILGVSIGSSADSQEWNPQLVDARDAGKLSRIATTSDGTPYILYRAFDSPFPARTYLAWWVAGTDSTGGWQTFQVDDHTAAGGTLMKMGLVVDSDDNLHVCWSDLVPRQITYGLFDTVAKDWSVGPEVVASNLVGSIDMAVFESGASKTPGIVVHVDRADVNGNMGVKFTQRSTAWDTLETIEVVANLDSDGLGAPAIAVDSAGRFHVTFYEPNFDDLKYATRTAPGIWIAQYVDASVTNLLGTYHDLVIDSGDVPHIVYYDATDGDLKYATVSSP